MKEHQKGPISSWDPTSVAAGGQVAIGKVDLHGLHGPGCIAYWDSTSFAGVAIGKVELHGPGCIAYPLL